MALITRSRSSFLLLLLWFRTLSLKETDWLKFREFFKWLFFSALLLADDPISLSNSWLFMLMYFAKSSISSLGSYYSLIISTLLPFENFWDEDLPLFYFTWEDCEFIKYGYGIKVISPKFDLFDFKDLSVSFSFFRLAELALNLYRLFWDFYHGLNGWSELFWSSRKSFLLLESSTSILFWGLIERVTLSYVYYKVSLCCKMFVFDLLIALFSVISGILAPRFITIGYFGALAVFAVRRVDKFCDFFKSLYPAIEHLDYVDSWFSVP